MKALYCLSFEKKTEWIDTGSKLVEYQLGEALLTFLNTDFVPYERQAETHREFFGHAKEADDLAEQIIQQLSLVHPFLENALRPAYFEPEKLSWLYRKLLGFRQLQNELIDLVEAIFFPDPRHLTAMQRLCILQNEQKYIAAQFAALSDSLRVERRIYVNGRRYIPQLEPTISVPENIESRLIFGSDDLKTVLMSELEEMAAQNILVKKCSYCGNYFIPFSSKTIYCDRLVGEIGKTCKELAAKEKYEKKIAANEGLSLYQRRNKTYAMRVSRSPAVYKDTDYQAWKAKAEIAVQRYVSGDLSLEALDIILELPKRK